MPTKEQERSAFALEMIEKEFPYGVDKDSANFIVGAPTMILTNGIAQTLAFLLSNRSKPKQYLVFRVMRTWLASQIAALRADSELLFLQKFSGLDHENYLKAQNEALAMLQWFKRYARAFEMEEKNDRHP